MKAVVAAFNQEKALVGAFSVITNLRMELFEALPPPRPPRTGKKLCPRPPRMAAVLAAAVAASSQLPLLLLATGVAVVELLLLSRDLQRSQRNFVENRMRASTKASNKP